MDVEKLPGPATFGPFATYVLWAVTADGNASNIGSIEVKNGNGELEATTPLAQFALIISAEPHFAVTSPSRAIVLQNLGKNVRGKKFNITGLKERIDYSSLSPQPRDERGKTPPDLIQARYALAIADGADAERLVPGDYAKAEQLLTRAEAAQKDKKSQRAQDGAGTGARRRSDGRRRAPARRDGPCCREECSGDSQRA